MAYVCKERALTMCFRQKQHTPAEESKELTRAGQDEKKIDEEGKFLREASLFGGVGSSGFI